MLLLGCLYILVGVSVGSATRHRKFLFHQGDEDRNIRCPQLYPIKSVITVENDVVNRFRLVQPTLVQKITVNVNRCSRDRALIERNFTVMYEDASDKIRQERIYSDSLYGNWGTDEKKIEILIEPVVYTDDLALVTFAPVQCSNIEVYGCTPAEMCPPNTCKNNGTCIGSGLCVCQKGFMGDTCDIAVSDVTYDDYGFIAALPNLLLTKDAAFDVSGDVKFSIQPPRTVRTFHHYGYNHYGSSCHFYGNGGSCHYSSSHNGGYSHNSHTTYGHHPSHSLHGSVLSHSCGYSYTAHVSYGHNHHHGSTHYLYTTHGTSHDSHGASLHYNNNQLCMHVHNANHYGQQHYQVVAPFHPDPGRPYSICSTYSPQYGASIYVNGRHEASQTKPTLMSFSPATTTIPTTKKPHTRVPQKPLCFGSCGASSGWGSHNCTMSNIGIAGGSVPFLANHGLFGLLGPAMMNLLLQFVNKSPVHGGITPTPTHAAVQTTTEPPVSATSDPGLHRGSVTSKYGPVCYDCTHVNNTASCSTKFQCNRDEVCLVFHDRHGYTQRCMNKQDCQKGLATTSADCWHCCENNLCNRNCTPVKVPSSTCSDDLQCFSFSNLGAYYDVCSDPVYASTICKMTCGNCP